MTSEMRIGLGQFNVLTDEKLAYIKQLGAEDYLKNPPDLHVNKLWEHHDLVELKRRAEHAEIR